MPQLYPIPDYPGYFITRAGDVFSTRKVRKGGDPYRLKPVLTAKGYLRVNLCKPNGKCKILTIHRLVAMVFLPPCPSPQHHIRHLDGDKLNNRVENLAWGTAFDNEADKFLHGTAMIGERNHQSKLTAQQVKAIREVYRRGGVTQTALAREMGVDRRTIARVVHNHTWNTDAALNEGAE